METKNEILKEIEAISPQLAQLQHVNIFTVPDKYFSELSDAIEDRIYTEKMGAILSDKSPKQDIPYDYFDNLSIKIISRIRQEALQHTLIDSIGNLNVYSVPNGYFDKLPTKVVGKINDSKESKVVPIYRKRLFKYAVAAMIAATLFVSAFSKFGGRHIHDSFDVVSSKTVFDKDALKYNSNDAFKKGLASLSSDQIADYLDSRNSMLSHDQLIRAANTDNMPEQLDYLSNDQVLEDYLRTFIEDGNSMIKQ